jgi:tRNA uridine 5-carbamoylmethylation protein Kti12
MGKSPIIIITGTSTSGKTTVYEYLKSDVDLKDIDFHDIDENDVPKFELGEYDIEYWRKYRVTQLLLDAQRNQRPTVLCGIIYPHEILENGHFAGDNPVYFLLLENSEEQIRKRWMTRLEEPNNSAMLNEKNIEGLIDSNYRARKKLHNSITALRNGQKLETTDLSESRMVEQAKQVILEWNQS